MQLISSFFIASGLENAIITAGGIAFLTPLWYVGLFAISQRINLQAKARAIISGACAALTVCLGVLSAFSPLTGVTVVASANYNGEGVIFQSKGQSVIVISEDSAKSFLTRVQNKYSFTEFDAVIILGGEDGFYETVVNLSSVAQKIYISPANLPIATAGINSVKYENSFTLCKTQFTFIDEYTVMAEAEGTKTLVCAGEKGHELDNIYCDILISNQALPSVTSIYTVYFSLTDHKYNICDYGDLIFELKNAKIKRKGILPLRDSLY